MRGSGESQCPAFAFFDVTIFFCGPLPPNRDKPSKMGFPLHKDVYVY